MVKEFTGAYTHTQIVGKGKFYISPSGKIMPEWYNKNNFPDTGNRQKSRSVTFPGIAKAMAEQWSAFLELGDIY